MPPIAPGARREAPRLGISLSGFAERKPLGRYIASAEGNPYPDGGTRMYQPKEGYQRTFPCDN